MLPKAPKHKRIKEKTRPMNAAEKLHADRLAEMGCYICGQAAQIHHERGSPLRRRDHRYLVPLCKKHHDERHGLGLQGMNKKHGVDLDGWAHEQWEKSNEQ